MNSWKRIQEYFSFTKNEQKVLLVLTLVFLGGIAVKAYKTYVVIETKPPYDYSRSDSVFSARSATLRQDSSGPALLSRKINVNTATKKELMELPGIGEAMADRILLFRQEKGKIRNIGELKDVRGIGDKKFQKLKPFIEAQ
ncbi:MAG: helix-hairpin-helix domain-containing protein [Bacteroidota bacterium]|jgi:competence protein ComEA